MVSPVLGSFGEFWGFCWVSGVSGGFWGFLRVSGGFWEVLEAPGGSVVMILVFPSASLEDLLSLFHVHFLPLMVLGGASVEPAWPLMASL